MIKRIFDIFFSLILIFFLFPIYLIVALWIKIDSSGPILYRQNRVGINGKIFRINKFRTMFICPNQDLQKITSKSDSRITSAGKFLRKFKVDELPQLINVLFGEMSFVGPRPEVEKFVKSYSNEERKIIFSVKPGITDDASIEFRNEENILGDQENIEEIYMLEVLPRKKVLHIKYVQERSFAKDLIIIWKTILVVIKG